MRYINLVAALAIAPTFASADGHLSEDAAMGEAAFKFCQSCHLVQDDDGNVLAGKRAKSGPNLYGVFGRQAGTVEGFKYSKSLVAAGEAGLVWDEETLAQFIVDPSKFLKSYLDSSKERSKMSFKARPDKKNDLTAEQVGTNFAKFLKEIGPVVETEADSETSNSEETEEGPEATN